jgi:signal transduction histidine kinase
MNNMIRTPLKNTMRGFSIQQRLPLLICVLLLSVMITFSWVSYFNVKKEAVRAGKERLRSLGDQLSSLFSQSSQAIIAATRTAARQPSFTEALQKKDTASYHHAHQALQIIRLDSTSILVDLLDKNGNVIVRSGKDSIQSWVNFAILYKNVKLDSGAVGKMQKLRDSIYYPIIGAVTDNHALIGYLVRWKLVSTTAKARQQFLELLGAKATIYFGNADKSLWTDMVGPVASPLPDGMEQITDVAEYTGSNHKKVLGVEKPVRYTPWVLLLEFSQDSVMESANSFLQWIIIIGTALVLIGIFIAWIMSRNITRPLNRLTTAVSNLASGRGAADVIVDRRDEIGKLARAFNAMSAQVTKAKQELEQKVIESQQMNEQLRDLSAHLQNIREEERIHIAREMHDELGQLLTGFKMDISWLNKRFAGNDDPALREKLSELTTIVDGSVSFVRRLAAELRPSILDDLGLVPALEWHGKEFTKRYGIEVEFTGPAKELQSSDLVATGLFRMYQESLTNVARHSGATKVIASLQITDHDIRLTINDNGKGFDMTLSAQRKTLGLLGMKERAFMIGGHLDIQSMPNKGTTIVIIVPLASKIISPKPVLQNRNN